MKKLTLRQSLKLCSKLWGWLEKNPAMFKVDWPGWDEYDDVENLCFACEYDLQQYTKNNTTICSYCPLKGLWGKNCMKATSPYDKWSNSCDEDVRQKNAKKIADFCDKELEELKTNKGV